MNQQIDRQRDKKDSRTKVHINLTTTQRQTAIYYFDSKFKL